MNLRPWKKRAESERRKRERAEERLRLAERDWRFIDPMVEAARRENEPDGWTAIVASIFGGQA